MLQEGKTVLTSGMQTLATGDVREWYIAVDQVLGRLVLRCTLTLSLCCTVSGKIEPVQVNVEQTRRVEFVP